MVIDYSKQYRRFGTFDVQEILDKIPYDENGNKVKDVLEEQDFAGFLVDMTSLRYRTFKKSGTKCVCCGLEGTYFILEQPKTQVNKNKAHFNLYGVKDGREIMLTKDHKHPLSKGGKNRLRNLQTMCSTCNGTKGNKVGIKFDNEK